MQLRLKELREDLCLSVKVERDIGRIPAYWNNDNEGKLIKWKERRRVV